MKRPVTAAVALLACAVIPALAQKPKKPSFPEQIVKAQYVMVISQREADLGRRPDHDDLRAIGDMEAALRKWNRYKLVYRVEEADLIISVRRTSSVQMRIGGTASGGGGRTSTGTTIGGEGATPGDHLAVYNARTGTGGPALWRKSEKHGLAAPDMTLLKTLQDEVEAAAAKTP